MLADDREYKTFPPFPWIKKECQKMGGDPRVEKGNRDKDRREKALDEEWEKQYKEWEKNNPEALKRWEEKIGYLLGEKKTSEV